MHWIDTETPDRVEIRESKEFGIAYPMLVSDLGALRRSIAPLDGKSSVLFAGVGLPAAEIEVLNIFEL